MAWLTTKDGRKVNTDWMDEDERKKYEQIEENQKQAKELNTGIPKNMPTKESLLAQIKKLKGKELTDAIVRLDSLGDYYREDKRQKRAYLEEVVSNNFIDDPATYGSIISAIEGNKDLVYVVTGVPHYGKAFGEKFGYYDVDKLQERQQRGQGK